ncbi:MAG: hypothetical protein MZV63_06830 [Marinilabiliales bacterium]|nr:hypothetical protein [Marinilabiliales bacterium]
MRSLWSPSSRRDNRSKTARGRSTKPSPRTTTFRCKQQGGYTLLKLNDGQGVHSMYHPDTLNYGGPWEQFSVGPYFYADRKTDGCEAHGDCRTCGWHGRAIRQPPSTATSAIDGYRTRSTRSWKSAKEYFGMNHAQPDRPHRRRAPEPRTQSDTNMTSSRWTPTVRPTSRRT